MKVLWFEDDEIDNLLKAVNRMQICFHPVFAPNGKFDVKDIITLQDSGKDVIVIVDKNIASPICEISRNGYLKDEFRMQKTAIFLTWVFFIGGRLTCGIDIMESDTSGLSSVSGAEERAQFLHGVERIPPQIWKELAFGLINRIPEQYLYKKTSEQRENYGAKDDLILLSNRAALLKVVQLLRDNSLTPVHKFVTFFSWYIDHLLISESMLIYAALIFYQIPHVKPPKGYNRDKMQEIMRGINNQAWDLTYIGIWSRAYYNEGQYHCMFATDDNTQKIVVVNIIPPGQWKETLGAICQTRSDKKMIENIVNTRLGEYRVKPFAGKSEEEIREAITKLIDMERRKLVLATTDETELYRNSSR